MARKCVICKKIPVTGNKVSHSNIKTKKRHFPNIQKVRAVIDGVTQRVYTCTRCLRSGLILKPTMMKRSAPAVQTA
ncbi:MAG: 50S ribosomal protein L28 [Deltaproteobacteria bacterium]|nr:50S ribosomal protein L28 [Deltaproteobacteria bacterium]